MEYLKQLFTLCKCGVFLTINNHQLHHQTTKQALREIDEREYSPDISESVRAGIIESGTLIELQFFPDTPKSSRTIVGYDIDQILDSALEYMEKR